MAASRQTTRGGFYSWNRMRGSWEYHPYRLVVTSLLTIVLCCIAWIGVLAYIEWHEQREYEIGDESVVVMEPTPSFPQAVIPIDSVESPAPSASVTPRPTPTVSAPSVVVKPIQPTRIRFSAGINPVTKQRYDALSTIIYPKPATENGWGVPSRGDIDTVPGRASSGKTIDPVMAVVWRSDGNHRVGPVVKADEVVPVLLGHTMIGDTRGAFKDIAKLPMGKEVYLSSTIVANTTVKLYVIKVQTNLPKNNNALAKALRDHPKGTVAALVTCSGDAVSNGNGGQTHVDNTVVFLGIEPVGR
ncbi:MAG: hypothetical protein KA604_02825 [Candidatus Saccharimonas sp.]|nr:hypothetical protein [Candidatus Saccharimonas sp.]